MVGGNGAEAFLGEGVGHRARVPAVAEGASTEVAIGVAVERPLPAVVAIAVRRAAVHVVLVGVAAPVLVVVGVVVAVARGNVGAIHGALGEAAVANRGNGLVRVHRGGVSPQCVNGVVAKHAAPARDEVVTSAMRACKAVSEEVVRVHEPVALIDVVGVSKGGVARHGVHFASARRFFTRLMVERAAHLAVGHPGVAGCVVA